LKYAKSKRVRCQVVWFETVGVAVFNGIGFLIEESFELWVLVDSGKDNESGDTLGNNLEVSLFQKNAVMRRWPGRTVLVHFAGPKVDVQFLRFALSLLFNFVIDGMDVTLLTTDSR
jgi:hypothetical protein